MKHVRKYAYNRFVNVNHIIDMYGEEDSAIFLNIIFKGKYVKVIDGTPTPRNEKDIDEGIVYRIFYISTSTFMILRFEGNNDIIINRAAIQAYEDLDYELGELAIKSKKYNI